ncbi:GGDEF domain-containing protein [Bordetella genomosp. 5]|nr:GGDEF domain-containing protein [Bordetella genomosp. 5]
MIDARRFLLPTLAVEPPPAPRRRGGVRGRPTGPRLSGLTPAIQARMQALRDENARLRALAHTDDLTGAYNRRYFSTHLRRALQANARAQGVALILFDLDDFKRINDQHGHHVGDRVLRLVARAANSVLRRTGDSLCRLGGDEFAAICSARSPADAMWQARQLMLAIRALDPAELGRALPAMTATFGLVWIAPGLQPAWRDIYAASDHALYRAKQAGKNDIVMANWPVQQDRPA